MKRHKLQLRPKIIEHLAKALGLSHGWLVFTIPSTQRTILSEGGGAWTFCFLRPSAGDILSLGQFTRTALKALIHIRIHSDVDFHPVGAQGILGRGQPPGTGHVLRMVVNMLTRFYFILLRVFGFSVFGLLVDTKVAVNPK